MSFPPRALRLLILLALSGTEAVGASGCDDPYVPPCKVTARRVLAADPAIGARPAITLRRVRDQVVAAWRRRDALDGGASPDADAGGPPAVTSFDVAIVDALGNVASRTTVPAPGALRTRRAGVQDVGVIPVDGAYLVHWTETTASTDPDGRVRTASAVKVSRVIGEDAAEPVTLEACERCVTTVSFVPAGQEALAVFRSDPDLPPDTLGSAVQPRFAVYRLRADGSAVQQTARWLALPPRPSSDGGIGGGATSGPVRALSAGISASGQIAITAGGRAWLADDALTLLSGPIVLPGEPDVEVIWEPSGEAAVAWSVSPFEDGRAVDEIVPREIFTGIVPPGSGGVAFRERTSRGRALLAFDRRGDDLGTVFESAGRMLFASVGPRGEKRGGDVVLGPSSSSSRSEYGNLALPEAHAVVARGDGRFTALTLGAGELVATEVVCAQ
jgi:hypothetical protein